VELAGFGCVAPGGEEGGDEEVEDVGGGCHEDYFEVELHFGGCNGRRRTKKEGKGRGLRKEDAVGRMFEVIK